MSRIITIYNNIKQGLSNLWTFKKVIWQFRPWDQCYLLNIMEKTLTEMVKAHEPGHLVKAERSAKQLKMAALLCKRLSEQNYYEKQHDEYFKLVSFKFKPTADSDLLEMTHEYKEPLKAGDLERRHKLLYKIEATVQKNDLKLLAKLIEKHLLSWWD